MSRALSGSYAATPSYCIWCEERPATPVNFPHCSAACKIAQQKQQSEQ